MLAAESRHAHGYFTRPEDAWTDRTYFDQYNSGLFRENRYTVFNARIGFERNYLALYVYGNNLTDSRSAASRACEPIRPVTRMSNLSLRARSAREPDLPLHSKRDLLAPMIPLPAAEQVKNSAE